MTFQYISIATIFFFLWIFALSIGADLILLVEGFLTNQPGIVKITMALITNIAILGFWPALRMYTLKETRLIHGEEVSEVEGPVIAYIFIVMTVLFVVLVFAKSKIGEYFKLLISILPLVVGVLQAIFIKFDLFRVRSLIGSGLTKTRLIFLIILYLYVIGLWLLVFYLS